MNLIWRAVTDCFLTKTQLRSKHVQIDNKCPVCDNGVESIFHALVGCDVAARCWNIFGPTIDTQVGLNFRPWLEKSIVGQPSEKKAKVITLCWSIWRARNDLVWNNKRWSALRTVAKVWEYLSQWKVAQDRNFKVPLQSSLAGDGITHWAKPQQDTVKMTADASVFSDRGFCGIGIIVHDHEGVLLGAKSKFLMR